MADRVRNLIPINSLGEQDQAQILSQGELIEFRKRKILFEEGERDPHTFFLLDGELELRSEQASPIAVKAGEDNARRALAQLQPRKYTAKTLSDVLVFRIERAVLNHILTNEQRVDDGGSVSIQEIEEDEDADWMSRLLSAELFTRLPPDHIQRFFTELEPLALNAGGYVIEQGTPGDYLYILAEGKAEVTRRRPSGGDELRLALLKEGDVFGEESLISNSPRNASVRMLTNGLLMRLSKRAFEELVSKPTLKPIAYSEACDLVAAGGVWLDVRFPDEHSADGIEGSLNLPLNMLRQQASTLDRTRSHVLYCDSGARAATGAFLLAKQGFDVCYLAGGLLHTPLGEAKAEPAGAEPAEPEPPAPAGEDSPEIVRADEAPEETPQPETEPEAPPAPSAAAAGAAAEPPPAEPAPAPVADGAMAEFQSRVTRLEGELKAAVAAVAEHKHRREEDFTRFKTQFGKLKVDRDEQAARGAKTMEAAHELKRRLDEALRTIQTAQAGRDELAKAVEAAKVDAQRRLEMEQSRLQGELDKLAAKLHEAEEARAADATKFAEDQHRSAMLIADANQGKEEAARIQEEAKAARAATEAASEARIRELQGEMEAATQRAAHAESEAITLRANAAAAAEADAADAMRSQESRDSEVESAVQAALERVRAEEARLESRQTDLETARKHVEDVLHEQESELEAERAAATERARELDRRENELDESRTRAETDLASRVEALAKAEETLSAEKADWERRIEDAIAQERAGLEQQRARLDEESEKFARERADFESTLHADRARAESELGAREQAVAQMEVAMAEEKAAHEAQIEQAKAKGRAEVEGMYRNFREEVKLAGNDIAKRKIDEFREDYETRLSEQKALLEDARSQLETEAVRLREALAETQRVRTELEAARQGGGAPAATGQPEPEEETDWLVIPGHEEDEAPARAAAAPEPEPIPEPEAKSERERVLNPNQLAEIRKKMQEKMQAHKASAA